MEWFLSFSTVPTAFIETRFDRQFEFVNFRKLIIFLSFSSTSTHNMPQSYRDTSTQHHTLWWKVGGLRTPLWTSDANLDYASVENRPPLAPFLLLTAASAAKLLPLLYPKSCCFLQSGDSFDKLMACFSLSYRLIKQKMTSGYVRGLQLLSALHTWWKIMFTWNMRCWKNRHIISLQLQSHL